MIEQTLMNLCVNARDAMPDGGTLTIATRDISRQSDAGAGEMSLSSAERYVLLRVSDTGCGMSAEVLEHIFEPFFTTKELTSGTGLGLATVYGIVKQHGGTIRVASEVGQGSTFEVFWPVSGAQGEIAEVKPRLDGAQRGTEKILLVEDDEAVRDLTRTILERAGYTIVTARNGTEAVDAIRRDARDVSLAIMDVVMPEMGGCEAYECMRKVRPDLKVLFASGYRAGGIHSNIVLDTPLNLLQKPFAPGELLHAVRGTLDRPLACAANRVNTVQDAWSR
jgi:CheY-like chemotaxis protein